MTPLQIAKQLRKLSKAMIALGVAMEYHGGFGKIADRGRELAGAGDIARDWARAIEAEHKTTGANPPASDSCTAEDAASPCAPTPARPAVSGSRARKAG
ncbi:MAG: hypothetical protein RL695_2310 [Pseudomonadota bacterium]